MASFRSSPLRRQVWPTTWAIAQHHASLAAHSAHLQLQLRHGVRTPAPDRVQRRLCRQPRPVPAAWARPTRIELDLGTIAANGASLCVDTIKSRLRHGSQSMGSDPARNQRQLWFFHGPALGHRFSSFRSSATATTDPATESSSMAIPAATPNTARCRQRCRSGSTHHFTPLASFTWAKLMTDDGNPPLGFVGSHLGAPQDWRDLKPGAFHQPAGCEVSIHRSGLLRLACGPRHER